MFLCRTGRLSTAAVDQALRSAGSSLVKANRPRDGALTLHKEHTVRAVYSTTVHLDKQKPDPKSVHNWDLQHGVIISDWAHLDRVSAVAAGLSRSVQSGGGFSDIIRQYSRRVSSRGEPAGNALFTGTWGVFTGTMQTRAWSTAAATKKKSEPGEEQTTDHKKEDVEAIKDPSTISSSTAKAPEEPEPEGGKPTKAQQLKKVFKEYGAVGVSFHIGISLMSLGMFYLLISSGIDMAAVLCKLGFSETVIHSKMAAGTSTFVLAYAIHKLFAPVRISITLVSVPLIVRYFRKTGLFKPPTPAP